MSLHDADVWNLHNYTKITFWEKLKHSPFTNLSVTILFSLLISDSLHGFLLSVDTCHQLPNVTNQIKPTVTQQHLMWCRHFTQDVPHCPISAHFVTIYFLHSISSSTKCNHIIFFNSIKFLFNLVVKFCSFLWLTSSSSSRRRRSGNSSSLCSCFCCYCSSFVAVVLVVVVVVVVVIAISAVPAAVQQTFLSCYK